MSMSIISIMFIGHHLHHTGGTRGTRTLTGAGKSSQGSMKKVRVRVEGA
jgi:hypothetical protein